MNIPSSVSHISLLCGTNNLSSHSPATISSTITEILFLLRQKCPTTYIHLFPILPRFDQLHEHVTATNSLIYFQVQELFPEFVLFHELPSSLYNQNLYRGDKLHLTTKGNDILVRWFHHCITTSNPTNPEPNTPPLRPCTRTMDRPCFSMVLPWLITVFNHCQPWFGSGLTVVWPWWTMNVKLH